MTSLLVRLIFFPKSTSSTIWKSRCGIIEAAVRRDEVAASELTTLNDVTQGCLKWQARERVKSYSGH